jgi:hypothetical protein
MTPISIPDHQPPGAREDDALGCAAFLGFAEAMQEWMPPNPDWDALSSHVKQGWIAAAKAARAPIS